MKEFMSDEKKQKFRQDIPDDDLIHLHDLSFDFEDYFNRFDTDDMSEDEKSEFSARVYGLFCRDFFNSGGNPAAIKPWVANYIAEKFYQALGGVPWQDIMNLPWDKPTPFYSPKGQRAFDIYAGVKNALNENSGANTTDLISEQAKKHNVSYETARSAYYEMKKAIESKTGIPPKFLNSDDEF